MSISQDISGNQYGQEVDPDEILPAVSKAQLRVAGKVRPLGVTGMGPSLAHLFRERPADTDRINEFAKILQWNAQRIAGTKQNQIESIDTV